ncbi:MAG TPA: hypothetical protein VIK99_10790 [Thermaerobacter sp.]
MPVRKLRPWCYLLLAALLTVQPHVHAANPEQALPEVPQGMTRAPAAGTGAGDAAAASSPAPDPVPPGDAAPGGAATVSHGAAGDPHDRAIRLLMARGVLPGGLPLPADVPVSRAELAVWLARALVRPRPPEAGPAQALELAAGFGWIPADWAGDTAAPGRPVTRTDLAAIARRVLGAGTGRWPEDRPLPADLADAPAEETQAALAALASGLLVPAPDGRFQGEQVAGAREVAAWLARLLELRGILFDDAGVLVARDVQARNLVVEIAGRDRVVAVADGAALYRNGRPATLEALRPGDEVRLVWDESHPPDRPGETPVALAVDAVFHDDEGILGAVSWTGRRIVLRDHRGPGRAYAVEEHAAVFLNGRPATLALLRPGDRVYVVLRAAGGTVRMLDATRVDVTGRLLQIDPVHGYLFLESQGRTVQLVAGDEVDVVRAGRYATLGALRTGDRVAVATAAPGVATYVEATPAGFVPVAPGGEEAGR